MRTAVFLLNFSWVLLIPGPHPFAHGQTDMGQPSGDGCMEPVPRPFRHPVLFPDPEPTSPSLPPRPEYFVSADGDLCQSFLYRPTEEREYQVAMERATKPGKAFLFSAVVPGAGQWLLGQERWPAYLAVELWAWLEFLDWRREGHDLRSEYKDLAWLVARRISTGPRTDAGWEYYEALTQYQSSGAYDRDPLTSGVQPEEDPTTFNGTIWALAQEIYLPEDPEIPLEEGSEPFEKALNYYSSRAYAPGLAWDWGSNSLHQKEYTGLIRKADEALRSSTGMIGVILANHLLSAVDALVSGRLGIEGHTEPSVQLLMVPGTYGNRTVALQVRLFNPIAHGF